MTEIKFGTDGWRAVIAEGFTFSNVERVAQATADFWNANPVPGVLKTAIVGFDRRFLSDQFALRTAEVLAGNGFTVILTREPTPTPAVSLAVKVRSAIGGIMITASHNPAAFNGFKLKAHYGGSADPAICKAVEAMLGQNPVRSMKLQDAINEERIEIGNLRVSHYKAIKRLVNFPLIARSKLKFAHDALFGVGAGCYDDLLADTTCKVTTLNAERDVNFGGIAPEPIAKNYAASSAFLRKNPHDLCLVTDGDADRIGGMDGHGHPLSTHQLICLLLRHLVVNRKADGRVVKALTTTSMVDRMCAKYGLELVETGVGFKYICAEMIKGNVLLGFEESGGIGFPNHVPERDGILAGLMFLEFLATEKRPLRQLLAQLTKEFGPHEYARLDTHFPLEKRAALMEFLSNHPPARLLKSKLGDVKTFDGVKFIARDGSWLMLRSSGTEPILRIYAEAGTQTDAQKLLQLGLRLTRKV